MKFLISCRFHCLHYAFGYTVPLNLTLYRPIREKVDLILEICKIYQQQSPTAKLTALSHLRGLAMTEKSPKHSPEPPGKEQAEGGGTPRLQESFSDR